MSKRILVPLVLAALLVAVPITLLRLLRMRAIVKKTLLVSKRTRWKMKQRMKLSIALLTIAKKSPWKCVKSALRPTSFGSVKTTGTDKEHDRKSK